MTPEDIFAGLAVPGPFPRAAMVAAGQQRDAMIPVFLDLIHRLQRAAPDTVAEDDVGVMLFAFYLLGEWRDARAYRPLAALLRRDSALLETLLGDALTEGAARVMAGVCDGDLAPILAVLEDAGADVFVRCQMIDALALIARDQPQCAADIRAYLEAFAARDIDKPPELWEVWAFAVADLGLAHLEPLVVAAYEKGLIPPDLSRIGDFRRALAEAVDPGAAPARRWHTRPGPIRSAIDELSGWYCFTDAYLRANAASEGDDWPPADPGETFHRDAPKVGRNDPCPCGSGRKFKKCCLG